MEVADQAASATGNKTAISTDLFRFVMRQVASPVSVIAAQVGERRGGLTATAVCSATADPPTILVCINRTASAGILIAEAAAFSVNFLSDEQTALARLFSTPGLESDVRFAGGTWTRAVTGAPLLRGAVGAFDCRVVETVPCGSHQIFLGRVVAAEARDGDPLLYRDGFFRKIAGE